MSGENGVLAQASVTMELVLKGVNAIAILPYTVGWIVQMKKKLEPDLV